jgi:hypothetical protein
MNYVYKNQLDSLFILSLLNQDISLYVSGINSDHQAVSR